MSEEIVDLREFVNKMTNIWMVEETEIGYINCSLKNDIFHLSVSITSRITFDYSGSPKLEGYTFLSLIYKHDEKKMSFGCREDTGHISYIDEEDNIYAVSGENIDKKYPKEYDGFFNEWLPIFRRNCYLSGCSIECSMHELIEWELWIKEKSKT